MSDARPAQANLAGRGRRVGIVVGRYNPEITDGLLRGASQALSESGVGEGDQYIVHVSGAFEIPLLAQRMLASDNIDGVVALGAVVRGGTPHFDYVCEAAMQGCLRVALDAGKPVAFGVLTCDSQDQARERSGAGPNNKGREAALALLESLAALDAV